MLSCKVISGNNMTSAERAPSEKRFITLCGSGGNVASLQAIFFSTYCNFAAGAALTTLIFFLLYYSSVNESIKCLCSFCNALAFYQNGFTW